MEVVGVRGANHDRSIGYGDRLAKRIGRSRSYGRQLLDKSPCRTLSVEYICSPRSSGVLLISPKDQGVALNGYAHESPAGSAIGRLDVSA